MGDGGAAAADRLSEGVRAVLAELGEDPGALSLAPIPGGASRETFQLDDPEGRRWVLRRDPPGAGSLVDQESEFEVIAAAGRAGVPIPPLIHAEPDGGRFGSAGFLMEHVEGESVAPRLLRRPEYERAREALPAQLARALAAIHATPVEEVEVLPAPRSDPALDQLAEWERQLDEVGEPLPAVELGLRWLRANAPEPAEPSLVHGDFRLGNFIVSERGLEAVIDWELAHLGDPVEDLGWLCIRSWRFGSDALPVAGMGELEPFLEAYEGAGGVVVERERLRFWEAFGNLKWAVICARQAHDHRTGLRPSHELASLGRRICEPEWDLLELIGEPA